MLGIFGALLYGIAYGSAWADDHANECNRRTEAITSGSSYYFDKNGVMRHSLSGTKYTTKEVGDMFKQNELAYKVKINEIEEYSRKKYYSVRIGERYNQKTHLFKTKVEAQAFYNENKDKESKIEFGDMYSDAAINDKGWDYLVHFVCHFEREKK